VVRGKKMDREKASVAWEHRDWAIEEVESVADQLTEYASEVEHLAYLAEQARPTDGTVHFHLEA
jgi:hypothetical protein